jgi:hypothetical protein
VQYEGIKHTNKIILMKVTSRERPEILIKTLSSYINNAANTKDMVWLFSFDEDDMQYNNFDFTKRIEDVIKPTEPNIFIYFGNSTGKIDAINRDVDKITSDWHILLNISDDQIPIYKGYDDVIRRFMPDDLDASLWFNDGAQDRINTQEIIGRTYYNRTGRIYNPIYKSLWCDNEATCVARMHNKLIKNGRCIIRHDHWAINKQVKKDELYNRNDKYYKEDQKTFNQRLRNNFQ